MTVESLPRGWISIPFLRLLFQNLLLLLFLRNHPFLDLFEGVTFLHY